MAKSKKIQTKSNETARLSKESSKDLRKTAKATKNKEALNPVLAVPEDLTKKFFLGYGLVAPVLDHFGNAGPLLVNGPMQRSEVPSVTKDLFHIAGPDGAGLFRTLPQHALIMAVDPNLMDLETLSTSPEAARTVEWQPLAFKSTIELLGGQHRIKALQLVLKNSLDMLTTFQKQIQKRPNDDRLRDQRKELVDTIRKNGFWLTAFYSKMLYKDDTTCNTVQLQLTSNNSFKGSADKAVHLWNNLLFVQYDATLKDLQSARAWIGSQTGDAAAVFTKYQGVCNILAKIHRLAPFKKKSLEPAQLIESKTTSWGFLNIFLNGLYTQLLFLASQWEPSPDIQGKDVYAQWNGLAVPNEQVMTALVELSEEAFKAHLQPHMTHCAQQGSDNWMEAMSDYAAELKEGVKKYLLTAQATETHPDVLLHLEARLQLVLDQGACCGAPLLPCYKDDYMSLPLLCPSFVIGLHKELQDMAPAIELVSSWFVPNLLYSQGLRKGKNKLEDFPSVSELFFHHLSYFYGKQDEAWATSEPSQDNPTVNKVCLMIVYKLFSSRGVLFTQLMGSIKELLQNQRNHKAKIPADFLNTWMGVIAEWCAECSHHHRKLKMTDLTLRLLQSCPKPTPPLDDDIPHNQDIHTGFLHALEMSAVSFFWGGSNNYLQSRTTFVTKLWRELSYHLEHTYPFLKDHSNLNSLKNDLLEEFNRTPGLHTYNGWFNTPSCDFEDEVDYNTALLGQTAASIAAAVVTKQMGEEYERLQRHWSSFLSGLCKNNAGIEVEEGEFRLHPALAEQALALYKTTVELQSDNHIIQHELTGMPLFHSHCPEPPEQQWDNVKVSWASTEEVKAHYEATLERLGPDAVINSKEDEESEDEEPAGPQPAAEENATKMAAQPHPSIYKERPASSMPPLPIHLEIMSTASSKASKAAEAKQLGKIAKAAKVQAALNPDLASPFKSEAEKYFLGFALGCVVVDHFGGEGPFIQLGPMQRLLNPAATNRLVGIAGPNGSGLHRTLSEHALIMTIDPDLLDLSSLSQNPAKASNVVWTPNASDSTVDLLAGQHRIECLKKVLNKSLVLLKQLDTKLAKNSNNSTASEQKAALLQTLQEQGFWLISFYNKSLYNDESKAKTIQLQLGTNNGVKALLDTPSHHLNMLLSVQYDATKEDLESARVLIGSLQGDAAKLFTKYQGVCKVLAPIHQLKPFQTLSLSPKDLLESKKVTWGFLGAILKGLFTRQRFLASTWVPPAGIDPKTVYTVWSQDQGEYSMGIMSKLTEFAEVAFKEHLQPHMVYFGQIGAISIWPAAIQRYNAAVKEMVSDWCASIDAPSAVDVEVLRHLPARLHLVLAHSALSSKPILPPLGIFPLLCPSFVIALNQELQYLAPAIEMVCSWFVPGILYHKTCLRASKGQLRDVQSVSELFFSHLHYFKGYGSDDWAASTLSTSYEEDEALYPECLHFIAQIITSRATLFTPYSKFIEQLMERQPTYSDIPKEFLESWMGVISQWFEVCHHGSGLKMPEVTPRMGQKCPIKTPQVASPEDTPPASQGEDDEIQVIHKSMSRALTRCAFNFFSAGSSGTLPKRTAFLKHLWTEVAHHLEHGYPFLEDHDHLNCFREGLFSHFQENVEGFKRYKAWVTVPKCSMKTPELVQAIVGLNTETIAWGQQKRLKNEGMDKLDQIWTSFMSNLSKEGVCGVKVENKSFLHPALEAKLWDLYKDTKKVQSDVQAVLSNQKDYTFKYSSPAEALPHDWRKVKVFWAPSYAVDKKRAREEQDEEEERPLKKRKLTSLTPPDLSSLTPPPPSQLQQ
ncbi:hypothetical protein B0H12DRAFT_1243571 [Mycena haematopus]|nr:hypothetical protein B0H12DRAFT_1243571 [Mycena haematopus]